jgi:hypothetical protein
VTGPPRDWDKELAEIDKIIAKQPAVAPGKPAPAAGAAALPAAASARAAAAPARRGGRVVLTTWVRVGLGVAVAVGVAQWPYAHACGLALYGYVAAAGGVVLAGLWGAVTSWSRRMGLAHIISLLVALWGGLLVGQAVLERTQYVRHPAVWTCP